MPTKLAKLIGRIAENLPEMPDEVIDWWLSNHLERKELLAGFIKEPQKRFEIWKKIKIGVGPNDVDSARRILKENNIKTVAQVDDLIGRPEFVFSTKEKELSLTKFSLSGLGSKNGSKRLQIYERAKELGLVILSPEVGYQLRMQYKDQPKGERIIVGTEPIRCSDGQLKIMSLQHDGSGLWLSVEDGSEEHFWNNDCEWIFGYPAGVKNVIWPSESPVQD